MAPYTEAEAKQQHCELTTRLSHYEASLEDLELSDTSRETILGMMRTVKLRIHLLEKMYGI